ncbi:MAG: RDD family protein [Candidatus Nanopelagicales bacterium]|nr:RDD family protein [Candidatus Nanopelagicales bacterium]
MTSFEKFRQQLAAGEVRNPAQVVIPEKAKPKQGHRSGIVTRAIAVAIDISVVIIVMLINYGLLWLFLLLVAPIHLFEMPAASWFFLAGFVLLWAYWTAAWALSGRTLGNHLMGIQVVDYKGARLTWPLSALRSILSMVFPIGLLWVVVSPTNRSIQDTILRTSVVHNWSVTLDDPFVRG